MTIIQKTVQEIGTVHLVFVLIPAAVVGCFHLYYRLCRSRWKTFLKILNRRLDAPRRVRLADNLEFAIPAGVTLGEALYNLYLIDPRLLEAIEQAHGSHAFASAAELVDHIESVMDAGPAAWSGLVSQYKGYLGELVAAERLEQLGHEVVMAPVPNQEGWDLLVDGEPVQVKSGLDADAIHQHLEDFPGIEVVTVEEHAEHFGDQPMVEPLDGFSGAAVEETTDQGLRAIEAIGATDFYFIPVSILRRLARNLRLWHDGRMDFREAVSRAIKEGSLIGGAAEAGGWLALTVLSPQSLAVAAATRVAGNVASGWLARLGLRKWCSRRFERARERLERSLAAYRTAASAELSAWEREMRLRAAGVRLQARLWWWVTLGNLLRKSFANMDRALSNEFCRLREDLEKRLDQEQELPKKTALVVDFHRRLTFRFVPSSKLRSALDDVSSAWQSYFDLLGSLG